MTSSRRSLDAPLLKRGSSRSAKVPSSAACSGRKMTAGRQARRFAGRILARSWIRYLRTYPKQIDWRLQLIPRPPLTLGIEEEYMLLDSETRALTSYVQEMLNRG